MLSLCNYKSRTYKFTAKEIIDNQIINSTELLTINVENYLSKGELLFKISNNSSKYLITHVNQNYKNSNVDYNMNLIDENLNTVFSDKKNNLLRKQESLVFQIFRSNF